MEDDGPVDPESQGGSDEQRQAGSGHEPGRNVDVGAGADQNA
jgi:hypothetical protein